MRVLGLVVLLCCVARADLEVAKAFAKEGKHREAAEAFGKVVAKAHKTRDLLLEQKAADAIAVYLDSLPPAPQKYLGVSQPIAIERILLELDYDHRGVFVSRTSLILESLYCATRTGVFIGVGSHGGLYYGRGRVGDPAMHRIVGLYAYAIGNRVPNWGSRKPARKPIGNGAKLLLKDLGEAQAAAVKVGFAELAAHITTEMIAVAHEFFDGEGCLGYLDAGLEVFPAPADLELLIEWAGMLRARLPKHSKRYEIILQRRMKSAKRPPAGKGGTPGAGPESALGAQWKRFKKGPRFLEIKRGPKGMTFVPKYKRKADVLVPHAQGERVRDLDGVHVLVHGAAVAIDRIDLTGRFAMRAEGPKRSRWRAYYLLVPKEKMSVGTKGVSFKRR